MEELKQLIVRNLRETEEVRLAVKKIQRYLFWHQVFGVFKVIIVVVPLVLAIFYGLPLFRQAIATYQNLLGTVDTIKGVNSGPAGIMKIIGDLEKGH